MSKITQSARGEACSVRIPGVCLRSSETVIWAHANGSAAGKGIGMKSEDILGAYACQACHDVYDRRAKMPPGHCRPQGHSREEVELMFWEGHARSLIILLKKGLVRGA